MTSDLLKDPRVQDRAARLADNIKLIYREGRRLVRQRVCILEKNGLHAKIMHVVSEPDGFVSYTVEIYRWLDPHSLLFSTQTLAIKSFGLEHRARRWAEGLLDRPEFMILRYNGQILYDA